MDCSEEKSNCQFCSNEIDKYQSSVVNGKRYHRKDRLNQYCSLDCAKAARRKREVVKCEHCLIEFEKLSNKKKRFCCRNCQWSYEAIHRERDYKRWASEREKIVYQHTCKICDKNFESNSPLSKYCNEHNKMKVYEEKRHRNRKDRAKERKIRLIELSGGGCSNCGYNKCHRALSFHHMKPSEKMFTLDSSNLYKLTWEEILSEFHKTKLLCMNCHMEVEELQKTLVLSLD